MVLTNKMEYLQSVLNCIIDISKTNNENEVNDFNSAESMDCKESKVNETGKIKSIESTNSNSSNEYGNEYIRYIRTDSSCSDTKIENFLLKLKDFLDDYKETSGIILVNYDSDDSDQFFDESSKIETLRFNAEEYKKDTDVVCLYHFYVNNNYDLLIEDFEKEGIFNEPGSQNVHNSGKEILIRFRKILLENDTTFSRTKKGLFMLLESIEGELLPLFIDGIGLKFTLSNNSNGKIFSTSYFL